MDKFQMNVKQLFIYTEPLQFEHFHSSTFYLTSIQIVL